MRMLALKVRDLPTTKSIANAVLLGTLRNVSAAVRPNGDISIQVSLGTRSSSCSSSIALW